MKSRLLIAVLLLFSVCACQTNKTTHIKVMDAYQPENNFDRLKITLWNISPEKVRVYFLIETQNLLYKKELNSNCFKAGYSIYYEFSNLETPKIIADSLTLHMTDSLHYADRLPLLDSIDITLPVKGKFVMQLKLKDENSQTENLAYISLDNTNLLGRQNFLVKGADGSIQFQPYLENPADQFYLKANITVTHLFVRYYKREYPIALPPYVDVHPKPVSMTPDSIFLITMNEGSSGPLCFPERGIYYIQSDTTTREGFAFFCFYKGYPGVNTAAQMLFPLRYITSKAEFNEMMQMKNSKKAVDDFWLDRAGNPDRARELIRKYYGRVQAANRYFTSYHEGWKTDRGIIYIIYGPPAVVYRNPDGETWIYGEDRNILSMTLNFTRKNNPFSDNDYELDRSVEYKETWYTALDNWRK